jgi:hypothetical protein
MAGHPTLQDRIAAALSGLTSRLGGKEDAGAARSERREAHPAYPAHDARAAPPPQDVRPAGPEAMRDPPAEWTRQDEALDETFPASDPTTKY